MAVYRNLQEQVFENAKDIEELQQNTNNLELDIIDEQNKTQQIQENVNNLKLDMVDVQNKTQQIQVSKDEPYYPGGVMYLHVEDGSTNHYGTVISQAYNLWHIQITSESGPTSVYIEPNNLRVIYNNNGKYTEWSVSEQISLNEQIKALLNK